MRKVLALVTITGLVIAVSSSADARGGGFGGGSSAGFGASAFSPGQKFRQNGPYVDPKTGYRYPGASGYAPGRQMRLNGGPMSGYLGATYWAPGRVFRNGVQ